MQGNLLATITKNLLPAFILTIIIATATSAFAAAIEVVASTGGNIAANTAKPAAISTTRPSWTELTPAQQQALAPLSSDWDKFDVPRKKKWLEIGSKFPKMTRAEQQRVQERMREWVKLTPEQRHLVRENYALTKKLNPTQKTTQWQNYQQLPDDHKKKLADEVAAKKRVANLPSSQQNVGKAIQMPKSNAPTATAARVPSPPPEQTPFEPAKK